MTSETRHTGHIAMLSLVALCASTFSSAQEAAMPENEWQVNIEWTLVDEMGFARPLPDEILAISKRKAEHSNSQTAEDLQQSSLRTYTGSIFVFEGLPAENALRTDSLLESRVSLHLESASIWEVLKEMSIEINRRSNSHRHFILAPQYHLFASAPPELLEKSLEVVDFDSVPARDVLHFLMRKSSIKIRYIYVNELRGPQERKEPFGVLNLEFWEDGAQLVEKQYHASDLEFWSEQLAEANSPSPQS